MKLYLGVNSDKETGIISKVPINRFWDKYKNENDTFSYNDTQLPPHWKVDHTGEDCPKYGFADIGVYIVVPAELVCKLAGKEFTWEDDFVEIEV